MEPDPADGPFDHADDRSMATANVGKVMRPIELTRQMLEELPRWLA